MNLSIDLDDIIIGILEESIDSTNKTFQEVNYLLQSIPNIVLPNEMILYEAKIITPEQVQRLKAPDGSSKVERQLFKNIRKASFGIEVDGDRLKDRGFKKDPYYKIFIGASNFKDAAPENRVRIAINNNKYSSHNSKSTAGLCLNSELKAQVDLVLKTKIQGNKKYQFTDGEKCETYYDLMRYNANIEGGVTDPEDPLYLHKVSIEDIPSVKDLPDKLPK